jgi:hypothetical protein
VNIKKLQIDKFLQWLCVTNLNFKFLEGTGSPSNVCLENNVLFNDFFSTRTIFK